MKYSISSYAFQGTVSLTLLSLLTSLGLPAQGGSAQERTRKVLEQFDRDADGRLNSEERLAAREWLKANPRNTGPGRGGRGGRGGGGRGAGQGEPEEAVAGKALMIAKDEVAFYPEQELYDNSVLRTIFIDFQNPEWMAELDDFYRTDVEVPATLTLDGQTYEGVGVGFRGNSSYFTLGDKKKKSMNISIDALVDGQRLQGYKTINLLNCHADPSYLREALHSAVANQFFPVLKASPVRLVINGESWGLYANVQQYNKDFLDDAFGTRKGFRWKIPAGRAGGGGLLYLGDDIEEYKNAYQMKSKGEGIEDAWIRLMEATRVLDETPDGELEAILPEFFDIDATLWFLAVDLVLVDGDGYFARASDYVLYEDLAGRFKPLPYDSNETFRNHSGRGGGPGNPATLETPPLALAEVDGRPLARLFSVPAWRARYLAHVRSLALEGLEQERFDDMFAELVGMIDEDVRLDEKGLYGYEAFSEALEELQDIVSRRREYLLMEDSLAGPWPEVSAIAFSETQAEEGMLHLKVRATVGGDAPIDRVLLYVQDKRRDPYEVISMRDDGTNGDATAGDGVYTAETRAFAAGNSVRVYVEARSTAEVGTTDFYPSGAAGHPVKVEVGKQ